MINHLDITYISGDIDPSLGNDSEIISNTTSVARQRLSKQKQKQQCCGKSECYTLFVPRPNSADVPSGLSLTTNKDIYLADVLD
jgi:hypothetical protein